MERASAAEEMSGLRSRRNSRTHSSGNGPQKAKSHSNHHTPSLDEIAAFDKVEALDFAVYDDMKYRVSNQERSKADYQKYIAGKWIVVAIVGVMTGLVALLVHYAIRVINMVKFTIVRYLLDFEVWYTTTISFIFFLLFNFILAVGSSAVIAFLVPAAAGSGIPEIKGYLNGSHVPKAFNIKTLFVKIFGVICAVGSSLACGPEGPMIHIGAILGAGISQGRTQTLSLSTKFFKALRFDREKREFISSGAAAGVSAAFGAPIGGLLFSLEEVSSYWNPVLTWRSFFGCMLATYTVNFGTSAVRVISDILSGSRAINGFQDLVTLGYNENGGLIIFGINDTEQGYYYIEIVFFLLLGIVGGLSGALFSFINLKLAVFRRDFLNSTPTYRVAEVAILSVVTSFVLFFLPALFPCQPLVEGVETLEPYSYQCSRGFYSPMATLVFRAQDESIEVLFMHGASEAFGFPTLFVFLVAYFMLAVVTAGSTISSGLVVPMILIGATYGRIVGLAIYDMGAFLGINASFDPAVYALIGASSFLGGVSRMTVAMTVIMLEITNDIQYLLPIMLAILVAKSIGDLFIHPLYDGILEVKCIPLLEHTVPEEAYTMRVKDAMTTPVVSLNDAGNVRAVVSALRDTRHNAFPVTKKVSGTDEPIFIGNISRRYLVALINLKYFTHPSDYTEEDQIDLNDLDNFHQALDSYTKSQSFSIKYEPNSDELDLLIDLKPFINSSTNSIQESASLAVCFEDFRTLGLRHIVVVNYQNHVCGILSRHDLLEWQIGEKAHKMHLD
jgi:chloride channel 7